MSPYGGSNGSCSRLLGGLFILAAVVTAAQAAPGEVTNLRALGPSFAWDPEPSATEYRVYRGTVSELAVSNYGDCYVPGLTRTDFLEPAEPLPDQAYFYLVTALDGTGEGTAGDGDPLPLPRPVSSCPDPDPFGLTVEVLATSAYELEDVAATLRISRDPAGGLPALIARFTLVGNDDPTLGSASADDYLLTDPNGVAQTYFAVFADGETSVDLEVRPVQDSLIEVPETLQLILLGDPAYTLGQVSSAVTRINDATNVTANERLLLAFLSSESGVQNFASGISVIRLQGDNDTALVELSFSGLTTPQSAVHIHVSNPVSGPPVESLPLGQVSNHAWDIHAAQFLLTDQQVLDALLAGQLYVNVHSELYPAGEIRGQYGVHEGSTELQVPPDPPELPMLTGEALDRDIARFLMQSTFGATPALMDELRQLIQANGGDRIAGMQAWIERQIDDLQTPPGNLLEFTRASAQLYADNQKDRRSGWWLFARYGQDQLRQRMAFALSEILVTSDASAKINTMHLGAADYYDTLIRGAFGSYRDLLLDVSLHPIMGSYLSHLHNQQAVLDDMGNVITSPDENYGREIMQLLSFGLLERHLDGTIVLGANGLPIQTYDNTVITEMARVFTGLSFSKVFSNDQVVDNNNFNLGPYGAETQTRWLYPLKMFQAYHDEGEKTLFGGQVIPAGTDGMQDIETVHDLLGTHPTTASFISRLLIQRLVTSNPSRGYIYRVAQVFDQTNGNLGELAKAILLDYEARSLQIIEETGYGKQKEPLLRLTALLRLLEGQTQIPLSTLSTYGYAPGELAKFPGNATIFRMRNLGNIGQVAQSSPTVFNFFLPDYRPPGALGDAGLVAPEFQISTQSQLYDSIDYRRGAIFRAGGLQGDGEPAGFPPGSDDILLDLGILQVIYDAELAVGTVQSASEAVVDFLDLHMNGGGLKHGYAGAAEPNPRSLMLETVVNTTNASKIKNAIYVVTSSPQLAIQR